MTNFNIVSVFIYFNFLTYFTVCNKDAFFAFTGCNATLEWNFVNSSYKQERIDFRIMDNAGGVIASKENNQCLSLNNLSVSCVIYHKHEDWIIVLALMNITTKHTGNYTAWVKEELHIENKTTTLIVIDKPRIMEIRKPVLYESFSVMCTTSYTSDCMTYYWKINGSDLQYSINRHVNVSTLTYKNVTMMDNLSTLTCQAGIENCNNILCNSSSEDSEPYTVEPYYGPTYVSLTLNKSNIYLQENATFKVKCSASCYPTCTFRWESYYINVDYEELVINSFNERLSGAYTCIARNLETGVTAKSYPIFLHHAKVPLAPGENQGLQPEQYWTGPIIVSVLLLIVGFVAFITHWRKSASREIDSENYERSCSKGGKKGASAKRSSLLRQSPNVDRSKTCASEHHDTWTRSHDLRNPHEYPRPNLQEDMYNTINEAVLCFYDYAKDNVIDGNSHDTRSITEHSFYDYASPIETGRVATADIHVTFENYITPVHDPVSSVEMCDNGEIDVLGTDQTCITPSSELAYSINEIKVHDSDHAYITPII